MSRGGGVPGAAYRFRVPAVDASGRVAFDGAAARKIRKVLRLEPGDHIVAVDRDGVAHRVRLVAVGADGVVGEAVDRVGGLARPARAVALLVALSKRMDAAVEKAAEAGAARIVPVTAGRSVASTAGEARRVRWRRIAETAAAQCGRADLPEVLAPVSFDEALLLAGRFGAPVLLHAPVAGRAPEDLGGILGGISGPVALLVGPEGGFTEAEAAAAVAAGARLASLGALTLRVETAVAVAVWAAARADGGSSAPGGAGA